MRHLKIEYIVGFSKYTDTDRDTDTIMAGPDGTLNSRERTHLSLPSARLQYYKNQIHS